jgi:hypothetical protein
MATVLVMRKTVVLRLESASHRTHQAEPFDQ